MFRMNMMKVGVREVVGGGEEVGSGKKEGRVYREALREGKV